MKPAAGKVTAKYNGGGWEFTCKGTKSADIRSSFTKDAEQIPASQLLRKTRREEYTLISKRNTLYHLIQYDTL